MGSLIVRILGVVGAAILTLTVLGSSVASADALTGQTYDDAVKNISGWNGKAVIGAVSGDQLQTGDCIVTSWRMSKFLDASGRNSRESEVLLSLNCNNYVASPGHPGNSAMSPEGVAAKQDQVAAENINNNPAWCDASDSRAQWCKGLCKRTGLCEY